MRTPLLKHAQIIRLGRLLDMMYKPSELAEVIDVNVDTIYRSYLPAGLPFVREEHSIWIHGLTFAQWAQAQARSQRRPHPGLPAGHGYCMKCNQPVPMKDPIVVFTNRYIQINQAPCPTCGCNVNRFSKKEV